MPSGCEARADRTTTPVSASQTTTFRTGSKSRLRRRCSRSTFRWRTLPRARGGSSVPWSRVSNVERVRDSLGWTLARLREWMYRQLGPSGLTVSRGPRLQQLRRPDRRPGPDGRRRRPRRRRHPLRHRRHLRTGGSEELLGQALGAAATTWSSRPSSAWTWAAPRTRLGRARIAALHPAGGRGQPAPAGHRPHRPLPAAPAPTRVHRSRRPWRRSTSSSPRARSATSAAPTSPAGRWSTPTGPPGPRATSASSRAQNEYSCSNRGVETELVPPASTRSGLLPFFPLANGLLTGKYRRGEPAPRRAPGWPASPSRLRDADFDRIEALEAFADERGMTMLRGGDRRPRGAAGGRLRDRRRHPAEQVRQRAAGAGRRPLRTWRS